MKMKSRKPQLQGSFQYGMETQNFDDSAPIQPSLLEVG